MFEFGILYLYWGRDTRCFFKSGVSIFNTLIQRIRFVENTWVPPRLSPIQSRHGEKDCRPADPSASAEVLFHPVSSGIGEYPTGDWVKELSSQAIICLKVIQQPGVDVSEKAVMNRSRQAYPFSEKSHRHTMFSSSPRKKLRGVSSSPPSEVSATVIVMCIRLHQLGSLQGLEKRDSTKITAPAALPAIALDHHMTAAVRSSNVCHPSPPFLLLL